MNRRAFLGAGFSALAAPTALARDPLALVTADTEAHVAVISLAAGKVRRRIATLEGPRSIQSGRGGAVVVGHSAHGAVTLLSGNPLRIRRVLRGFQTPRYAVFSPDGRYAYVSDGGTGELVTIDVRAGRVVHRVSVGAGARHLSLHPRGASLWVALGNAALSMRVVSLADPARPRAERMVRMPWHAHDVGFSPSGRRVWVTAAGVHKVAILGGAEPKILTADAAPQHVSFASGRAFIASGLGRSIRVHSLQDGRLLKTTRVPLGSYNVQSAGSRVLTPSLDVGSLTVLDASGRTRGRVRAAEHAHDACVV